MWKVKVLILVIFSLDFGGCFFPNFPFPEGINFPQNFFPRLPIPNMRPPGNRRPPNRPPSDRERCPDEGFKLISHPRNCEKYILCLDGEEVSELTCPDELHFSRITRSCVDPRAAGCEPFDWECPDNGDPSERVFIPNQDDCSAYYLCWQGTQVPLRCPGNQHWSIFENQCMDPSDAMCQFSISDFGKEAVLASKNATSMTAAQTFGTCPETGIVSIPNPNSCEEFYLCVHGMQFERQCPPGLHFSAALENCVDPDVAQCVLSDCPPTGIAFLPHEDDCTRYYICFHGIRNEMQCNNDFHWSTAENRCMEPSEAGCEEAHDECPATGIVQIPDPESCEKFILCINGFEVPLSCAPGLHFSPTARTCMPPDEAECEEPGFSCPAEDTPGVIVFIPNTEDCSMYYLCWQGSQIPLSCRSGDHWSMKENRCMPAHLANCPWDDGDDIETCPDEGIKAIEHPEYCERYILCVNGHEVERDCGHGLHFSRELRNCVHPIIADCRVGRTFELPKNGTCPVLKEEHDFLFIPDVKDCNSYILCLKDQSKMFNCAKGLHFDVNRRKCMMQHKAKCIIQ